MTDEVTWLTGPQVRQRFSISAMGLYRWLKDARLQFPHPVKIRERLFWRLNEIEEFEHRMMSAGLRSRTANCAQQRARAGGVAA
jgi:predicted DNA-binding transcriptional regulator AlpA